MNNINEKITTLINKRNYYIQHDVNVEDETKEINDLLRSHFLNLEVDFIIESLTHLGFAPNILYDDNGNFQITDNCFHEISLDDDFIEGQMVTIVNKNEWFKSIREALKHYLFTDG